MERAADHGDGGGGGGSGPSSLERRVAVLEGKVDRIEAAVHRIELQLAEILAELRHVATKSDIAALRAEMIEANVTLRGEMIDANATFRGEASEANAALRTDIGTLRGKFDGLEGRFAQIPTIWQIIAVQSGFTFGIAAIIFAVGNYLKP